MPQSELELESQVQKLFPGATQHGRACWSAALQNGRSHWSRVYFEDDTAVLTTGPLDIPGSPQRILAWNAVLPAASRIVCNEDGLQLRTEWVLSPDATAGDIWETARRDFQAGLDLLGGESVPPPAELPAGNFESQEPAPRWNARANGDGTWSVPLPHAQAALQASAALVKAETIAGDEHADEVRAAVAEVLLRGTSYLRFVKACATPDGEGRWAAWIQASPAVCGMDAALAAVALAHRECAAAARALSEVRLALRFREVCSAWRDCKSNPKEGR